MSNYLKFFDEESGYAEHLVWIGNVKLGTVVQSTDFAGSSGSERVLDDMYGHVVGFMRNGQKDVILDVLWDQGVKTTAHPSTVKIFLPIG